MTRTWLPLVARLSLALLVIANGPATAALAAFVPAGGPADCLCPDCTSSNPEPRQEQPSGCGCGRCGCPSEQDCTDVTETPSPQAPDQSPAGPGDETEEPAIPADEPSGPSCPGCPHCPSGCCWCAAKAPCCLLASGVAVGYAPCIGPNVSELPLLPAAAPPDDLFHPPRA